MKYRATAHLPGIEIPRQIFSAHLDNIRDWARRVACSEKVKVEIHVYEERLLETVEPPPEPELPKKPCEYNHETLKTTSARTTCPGCGETLDRA